MHEEIELGVIESGHRVVRCRGTTFRASAGTIVAFSPGEVHAGSPVNSLGSMYRAFLIPRQRLAGLFSRSAGTPDELPLFDRPVIQHRALARKLVDAHEALSREPADDSKSNVLLDALEELGRTRASTAPYERLTSHSKQAAAGARDYINAHHAELVRLDDIASAVDMSVFHLIRVFRTFTGLTPYAYLSQVRVHRASGLLREGVGISLVACLTGFSDQSHLTRMFKRLVGVTPGEYRRDFLRWSHSRRAN